jgi:short-subunit dehydrogenase
VELAGKTVLLSGATGGIGMAIAKDMAGRGARLILSARRQDALEELAPSLAGDGHRVIAADLADDGAAERLVREAGQFDVLVANAALPASGKLDDFSQEELGRALRVNLEAPVRMARELLPAWRERNSGHFVFISSLAGKAASPRSSLYSATKFGLRGFALGLRADLAASGLSSSVVMPGFIRDAGMFADSGAKPPMGVGTSSPEEVAEGVAKAVEQDRAEVEVAPLRLRMLANFAARRPALAGKVAGGAASKAGDELARGQASKR